MIDFFRDVVAAISDMLNSPLVPGVSILDGFREALRRVFSGDLAGGLNLFLESLGTFGEQLRPTLEALGQQVVDWIGSEIPPILEELGKLLSRLSE